MFRLHALPRRACSHKALDAVHTAAHARAMPASTKAARSAPSVAAVPAAKRAKKAIPVVVAPVLTEDGLPVLYQYPELIEGRLVRRYKRFLADAQFCNGHQLSIAAAEQQRGQSTQQQHADSGAGPCSLNEQQGTQDGGLQAAAAGAADSVTVVHCPNTGALTGLLDWPLAPIYASVSAAKGRKYVHTLEYVQASPGGAWVGVHSVLANRMALAMIQQGLLPELGAITKIEQEVKYGQGSRVDFVLTRECGKRVYVEVKSVTLAEPYDPAAAGTVVTSTTAIAAAGATMPAPKAAAGSTAKQRAGKKRSQPATDSVAATTSSMTAAFNATTADTCQTTASQHPPAGPCNTTAAVGAQAANYAALRAEPNKESIALFPDAVSQRAQRHVQDLMDVVAQGHEACCLFVIQRGDCSHFAPCHAVDPQYGRLLLQAHAAGVKVLAARCELRPPGGSGIGSVVFLGHAQLQLGCRQTG